MCANLQTRGRGRRLDDPGQNDYISRNIRTRDEQLRSLPCVKGGGFCVAKDGRIVKRLNLSKKQSLSHLRCQLPLHKGAFSVVPFAHQICNRKPHVKREDNIFPYGIVEHPTRCRGGYHPPENTYPSFIKTSGYRIRPYRCTKNPTSNSRKNEHLCRRAGGLLPPRLTSISLSTFTRETNNTISLLQREKVSP